MAGIFGDMDAREVPTDPNFCGGGDYKAYISDSKTVQSKGRDKLTIQYTLTSCSDLENEEYVGNTAMDWFDIFPNLTQSDYDSMDPQEKRRVKSARAAVKKRLEALGVDMEDVENGNWEPKHLMDLQVSLSLVNNGPNNEYTNVRWVELDTESVPEAQELPF